MKVFFAGIITLLIFVSCESAPSRNVNYNYPHSGGSNNAQLAVKDYVTLGIIFVRSSEAFDGYGNHTGSKITYAMIMQEAQKLGADDIINLRIDINQREDFTPNGDRIRTTYNYTATALAIKYTTAMAVESRTSNFENNNNVLNNTNNAIAANQMKRPTRERSSPGQSANLKNNWLSAGATIGGADLRYERMFNSYFSLSGNVYYQLIGSTWDEFGVDAIARVYPFGKVLYFGAGLGFHGYYDWRLDYRWVSWGTSGYWTYYGGTAYGFAVSPEIGVKIHFGRQGMFFMDIGYKNPLIIGSGGFMINTVPHINFGVAF